MRPSPFAQWPQAWNDSRFRLTAIVLAFFLPVTLLVFRAFLDVVELRQGVVLVDPLLPFLTPVDLTWITFGLIYGGLVFAIIRLLPQPSLLLRMIAAYIILVLIRMACMYAVPLEPPPGAIPLVDPFVEFFGAPGTTLTRDLFFSGHTAILFLLGLGMPARNISFLLFLATGAVAVCVLVQHVHYTIDVLVAPLAAYAAFRLGVISISVR